MHTFANHAKTALLMGGLMGLFLLVGSMWGQGGMMMAVVFGGLTNVAAWFFSDRIAVSAMRGKEVTAEGGPEVPGGTSSRELYDMVDELRRRANLPMPKVYVCPHAAPNAFATGRSPSKSAVAVTAGLLQTMNRAELEGVVAHELAHIKNRDTTISTIAGTIAGVLAFLAQWGWLFGGRREGGNPLVMFAVLIIAALGAVMIQMMISRSREYIADADGAAIAGTPDGLASALRKLDSFSRRIPLEQPNPAQNNLFIVEPLAGGGKSLTNLFATHPPVEKRLAALERLSV